MLIFYVMFVLILGFSDLSPAYQLFIIKMLDKLSNADSAQDLRNVLAVCIHNADLRAKCGLPPNLDPPTTDEISSTSNL